MSRQTVRIEGLVGVLDMLNQLPPQIVSKAGGPVRLALKKGAEVLRDEARMNVRGIVADPNVDGLPSDSTGLLESNIVSNRSKPIPGVKGERYVVRVRNKPYEVSSGAKSVSTPQVARLLEFGSERMQPQPWLRPAFDSKKNEALDVFSADLRRRVDVVVKRLQRKAKKR